LLELGQRALDEGDPETAAEWFETAIEAGQSVATARFCLGLCLDELGRLEAADDALAQARKQGSDDPMARYAHAGVLAQLGRNGQALALLERLIDEAPRMQEPLRDDEAFDTLSDHPRFLALTGDL
jgi:tetratricopeptide (TPR) repeat protein